jgi:hypothetical protein
LRVKVGSTLLTGPRGAFTSSGSIRITTSSPRLRPANALRAAGEGVAVELRGTRLRKPLTVSYRVGRRPAGFQPRVAHLSADGTWQIRSAKLGSSNRLVYRTRSFSLNVPSWLNPKRWASNLKQWAKNAANWVASGLGGRTPALTNCGEPAPDWFGYEKASDMVHVCSITNGGRAEIQLKSNRGMTLEVQVPGSPSYVWVEDQPFPLRKWVGGKLGHDPDALVLLGPGQRMTIGYDRPVNGFTGDFTVASDTWRAFLDDGLRAAVDAVAGAALPSTALLLYTWGQCGANAQASITGKWVDPPGVKAFIGCMFKVLPTLYTDPKEGIKALQTIGLDGKSAGDLVARAKALSVAGLVLEAYPLLQATAIHDIDDSLRALLKGGNDRVSITLQAGGQGPQPVTDSQGAPADSGNSQPATQTPSQPATTTGPTTATGGCNGSGGTSAGGAGRAGFHVEDVFLGGTWARGDPCDGEWHSQSSRPANAAYWYRNGLGVGVDCARTGASYRVRFADGRSETWRTWFHVTDGKWVPSAAMRETNADGYYGLPSC